MDTTEPKDFTDLTCTNLTIKLKILLKRLPHGDSLAFFATREQVDNTCSPFSDHGYKVSWDQTAENRFLVRLRR